MSMLLWGFPKTHVLARDSRQHDIELNPGPHVVVSPEVLTLRANVGCALHQYDVRAVLTASGLPPNQIDAVFQQYINNTACMRYHDMFSADVIRPAGVSAARVAQAFRAVYVGPIRCRFIEWLREAVDKELDVGILLGFPLHSSVTGGMSSFGNDEDVDQYPDEIVTGLLPDMVHPGGTQVDSTAIVLYEHDRIAGEGRHFCNVCEFDVVTEGHAARCRKVGALCDDATKAQAWIGDAAHMADIREIILARDIPAKFRTIVQVKFTAGVSQARYISCSGHAKLWGADNDTAVHDLSTLFEAHYRDEFRRDYLEFVRDVFDMSDELWTLYPGDIAVIIEGYFTRK